MKIDNSNPVGLEWQEVVGELFLYKRTSQRHIITIASISFTNRTERKEAFNKLNRIFRPYLRPKWFYWQIRLDEPLNETNSFSFNPQYYDSNNT